MIDGNLSGKQFESMCQHCMRVNNLGFDAQYRTGLFDALGQEIRVDIRGWSTDEFKDGFYVSCKWQNTSGSAKEKIVHEIQKCRDVLDIPTFIVIDGKETVVARNLVNDSLGKNLLAGLTLGEFLAICQQMSKGCANSEILREFNPQQGTMFNV